MSYLHCHKCRWQQDDFYSAEGCNPAKFLSSWDEQLLGPDMDRQFTEDAGFIRKHGPITMREVIARQYEMYGQRIRGMKWVTREQWRDDPNKNKCPRCGHSLCED